MPVFSILRIARSVLFALSVAGSGLAAAQSPLPCPGHPFAATATVDGKPLQLNGVGMRAVAWLQGYVAGLYLEGPPAPVVSDPLKVIKMGGAKRLEIRMLESAASKEFTKALVRGIKRHNKDAIPEELAKDVAKFGEAVDRMGELKKGTVVFVDMNTAGVTTVRVRDQPPVVSIEGKPFNDALLQVFLGEKPTDPELKTGLLGGKGC